jgi:hypothetical protein
MQLLIIINIIQISYSTILTIQKLRRQVVVNDIENLSEYFCFTSCLNLRGPVSKFHGSSFGEEHADLSVCCRVLQYYGSICQ